MAEVIGMGHGGDGAGEHPPGGGGGFGLGGHQQDVIPRKTRGKAKNLGLDAALRKRNGQPLELPFDEDGTNHPVGKPCDYFTRELGIYMWRNIALDREGWRRVDAHDKNALDEHLKAKFDIAKVERDLLASGKKGGIRQAIQKRFSDRKNNAKREFLDKGGYDNLEAARNNVPEDMSRENWNKAINHFLTPEHIKRSATNKACRQLQKYPNRGGTSSYASTCYKQNVKRVEAFHNAHTDKNGNFDSPIAEEEYRKLLIEYELVSQRPIDQEDDGGSKVDEVAIFEKVMGQRRGHVRGIGPRPPLGSSPGAFDTESPPIVQHSKAHVMGLFENPDFCDQLQRFMASSSGSGYKMSKINESEDEGVEDGGNDDEDMNMDCL